MGLWWIGVPVVEAHPVGMSSARVEEGRLTLTLSQAELSAKLPLQELPAARLALEEGLLSPLSLSSQGARCALAVTDVTPIEGDGVEVHARLTGCAPTGPWAIDARDYLAALGGGHRLVIEGAGAAQAVLSEEEPTAMISLAPASSVAVARDFVGLGVEHIWTGYDHLLFLAGLLLVTTRLRDALFVITGFTLAHSITLTLAALGFFTLPASVVEPAIAASIVFVGVENFWSPPLRRRVVVTFFLGLIHGFGFAGLLREIGLPSQSLVLSLGCFNLGVELGQLAVVAVIVPLLLGLRRADWFGRRVVPVLSVAVAMMGIYWLVERLGAA